jgi:hypothetical protein
MKTVLLAIAASEIRGLQLSKLGLVRLGEHHPVALRERVHRLDFAGFLTVFIEDGLLYCLDSDYPTARTANVFGADHHVCQHLVEAHHIAV